MKATETLSKAEVIDRSLRCFSAGLASVLPLVGIPFAVYAVVQYRRVRRGQGDLWNPARRYLFWGGVCARMSLVLYLLVPVVVALIGIIGRPYGWGY